MPYPDFSKVTWADAVEQNAMNEKVHNAPNISFFSVFISSVFFSNVIIALVFMLRVILACGAFSLPLATRQNSPHSPHNGSPHCTTGCILWAKFGGNVLVLRCESKTLSLQPASTGNVDEIALSKIAFSAECRPDRMDAVISSLLARMPYFGMNGFTYFVTALPMVPPRTKFALVRDWRMSVLPLHML